MTRDGRESSDRALAAVRDAWIDALGLNGVESDDDFFVLGGHSLLVLEVVDAVEETTGVAIPPRYFFDHPRLGALAEYVAANS